MTATTATYESLSAAFQDTTLFQDKTWRLSPEPWPLTAAQVAELRKIGQACVEFYHALETLYLRSAEGKNVLRNSTLEAPWVAEYLDRGKPERLLRHGQSPRLRSSIPTVLRPDLLLTDDGFALTEMDSVPGGVGLLAFLNRLYDRPGLVGEGDALLNALADALEAQAPTEQPLVAFVVSDEAETYRPEFEWLAARLREQGRRFVVAHPDDLMPLGEAVGVRVDGKPERLDVLYRFFELFDLANLRHADALMATAEAGTLCLTPPMKAYHEEKLSLALLHHPILETFWKEHLSRGALATLRRIVPRSWVVEPADLPPNAVLDAPYVDGKPIRRWEDLARASQRERGLILKASGFHETAWGARSVVLGSDVSRDTWLAALRNAVALAGTTPHVLQAFHKPRRLTHPVFDGRGGLIPMEGRLRLCPYYVVRSGQAELSGALATFCPADKKIIHGMSEAVLLPCLESPALP